jgi:predicted oxidoreductase
VLSFPIREHLPQSSRLVLGCMGFGGGWNAEPLAETDIARADAALDAALGVGITVLDHADIYTLGKAEQAFGALFQRQPSLRDRVLLQSKCGIRFADADGPKRYDLSAAHIERSVEASLRRLHTDRLDLLLLHRPDPLMQPAEVAEAFSRLHRAGKVRFFGGSNMHAAQLRWLGRHLSLPLVANQLQMSLLQHDWLEAGTTFNDPQGAASPQAAAWPGTLEHCQAEGVQLQAWGALAQGRLSGRVAADATAAQRRTAALVVSMAEREAVSPEAVLLAWLLRHPAHIQPVIGTADPARIRACAQAQNLSLSREDWYALYEAARGRELP